MKHTSIPKVDGFYHINLSTLREMDPCFAGISNYKTACHCLGVDPEAGFRIDRYAVLQLISYAPLALQWLVSNLVEFGSLLPDERQLFDSAYRDAQAVCTSLASNPCIASTGAIYSSVYLQTLNGTGTNDHLLTIINQGLAYWDTDVPQKPTHYKVPVEGRKILQFDAVVAASGPEDAARLAEDPSNWLEDYGADANLAQRVLCDAPAQFFVSDPSSVVPGVINYEDEVFVPLSD